MISSLQFYYMHAFDESGKHSTIVLGGALFLIAAPLEICRLYLGYSGNLRENVCFINIFRIVFIFFIKTSIFLLQIIIFDYNQIDLDCRLCWIPYIVDIHSATD